MSAWALKSARLLVSDVIDFMRLSIAGARRFPDLASVGRMARERGAQAVTQVLSEMADSDEMGTFPAFAPERLATPKTVCTGDPRISDDTCIGQLEAS